VDFGFLLAQPAKSTSIYPAPQYPNPLGGCSFCLGDELKIFNLKVVGWVWEKANTRPAPTPTSEREKKKKKKKKGRKERKERREEKEEKEERKERKKKEK
jgi:hypothetical protein